MMKLFWKKEQEDDTLTLDYIVEYLRGKGLAVSKDEDISLLFKNYELNWKIFLDKQRFVMYVMFMISNTNDYDFVNEVCRRTNLTNFLVKNYISFFYKKDKNGNKTEEIESCGLVFAVEALCTTKSSFREIYEYAVYAILESIENHRKILDELENKHKSQVDIKDNDDEIDLSDFDNNKEGKILS
ncbi:MAG: hypothetical protein IJ270_01360 [Paludibacteraceae bacterium]|nr:hypothetical protein [Paludibacteraceae bacterium]